MSYGRIKNIYPLYFFDTTSSVGKKTYQFKAGLERIETDPNCKSHFWLVVNNYSYRVGTIAGGEEVAFTADNTSNGMVLFRSGSIQQKGYFGTGALGSHGTGAVNNVIYADVPVVQKVDNLAGNAQAESFRDSNPNNFLSKRWVKLDPTFIDRKTIDLEIDSFIGTNLVALNDLSVELAIIEVCACK